MNYEYQLRQLIESILLESVKSEQRYLIEKYPQHAAELGKMKDKWISWLADRFGTNPVRDETFSFDQAMKAVGMYPQGLGDKYNANEFFRDQIKAEFPPEKIKVWRNLTDPTMMTAAELVRVTELSKEKKPRIKIDRTRDISGLMITQAGPWKVYEPSDRESSCNIIGVKPGTNEPRANICIARTDASNLFYNYAISYTLFIIMRGDNPTEPEDILVVGFKDDGTPEFNADRMHNPTVDGSNHALNSKRLRQILGEYHDEIMSAMSNHVLSRDGSSPARQKIHSAAIDIDDFNDVLRGISTTEAQTLKQAIATQEGISSSVQQILAADQSDVVRQMLAANKDISNETMLKLIQDPDFSVRGAIAGNQNISPDVLHTLSQSESDPTILGRIARSPRVHPDTLTQLIDNPDEGVRIWAASNPRTPTEVLRKAARRGTPQVRRAVAQNKAGHLELLRYLADDPDEEVRRAVMNNPHTPDELVQQIRSGGTMAGLRQLIRRMI